MNTLAHWEAVPLQLKVIGWFSWLLSAFHNSPRPGAAWRHLCANQHKTEHKSSLHLKSTGITLRARGKTHFPFWHSEDSVSQRKKERDLYCSKNIYFYLYREFFFKKKIWVFRILIGTRLYWRLFCSWDKGECLRGNQISAAVGWDSRSNGQSFLTWTVLKTKVRKLFLDTDLYYAAFVMAKNKPGKVKATLPRLHRTESQTDTESIERSDAKGTGNQKEKRKGGSVFGHQSEHVA